MRRHIRRQKPGQEWRNIKNKKLVSAIYIILRVLVVATMVAQFFNRNYENVLLCLLTLVLFTLPSIFERRLHIDLPDTLEIIILLFAFSAEILGEISSFYMAFPYWDTMLHTMNGFLCAAIGFALVDILNRTERVSLSLSPFFMAVMAFCFSMTIGVLWEFYEFAMDHFFLADMQKDTILNVISTVELNPDHINKTVIIRNIRDTILVLEDGSQVSMGLGGYLDIGIVDTMEDLFVNFIGATVFSIIGFFYVNGRGKGRFAPNFIPQLMNTPPENEDAKSEKSPNKKKKENAKTE